MKIKKGDPKVVAAAGGREK